MRSVANLWVKKKINYIISSLLAKNEVTVIDLWASWCGSCRQVTPILKKVLSKYQSKGLGIVGLTLDEDKEGWILIESTPPYLLA